MSHNGYVRWYDQCAELSEAVRLMETTIPHLKVALALRVLEGVETDRQDRGHDSSLRELGSPRITGLLKSKSKRRWYDKHPTVHRAFNQIFLMDNARRAEYGLKIIVSIKLFDLLYSQGQTGLHRTDLDRITRNIFKRPHAALTRLVGVYAAEGPDAQSLRAPGSILEMPTTSAIKPVRPTETLRKKADNFATGSWVSDTDQPAAEAPWDTLRLNDAPNAFESDLVHLAPGALSAVGTRAARVLGQDIDYDEDPEGMRIREETEAVGQSA